MEQPERPRILQVGVGSPARVSGAARFRAAEDDAEPKRNSASGVRAPRRPRISMNPRASHQKRIEATMFLPTPSRTRASGWANTSGSACTAAIPLGSHA